MASSMSTAELERVFIEKLTEKYKLNDRDIKKAFCQFDVDGNGLLDLDELQNGFKLFLNGVSENQIRQLVARYDINGDNKISFEEFIGLLRSRQASISDASNRSRVPSQRSAAPTDQLTGDDRNVNRDDVPDLRSLQVRPSASSGRRTDPRRRGADDADDISYDTGSARAYDDPRRDVRREGRDRYEDRRRADDENQTMARDRRQAWGNQPTRELSTVEPELDFTDPEVIESQAQIFLHGLHGLLAKRAKELRIEGKVKHQLTLSASELTEAVATKLIDRAFQQYTGSGDSRNGGQGSPIGFPEFGKYVHFAFFS